MCVMIPYIILYKLYYLLPDHILYDLLIIGLSILSQNISLGKKSQYQNAFLFRKLCVLLINYYFINLF